MPIHETHNDFKERKGGRTPFRESSQSLSEKMGFEKRQKGRELQSFVKILDRIIAERKNQKFPEWEQACDRETEDNLHGQN